MLVLSGCVSEVWNKARPPICTGVATNLALKEGGVSEVGEEDVLTEGLSKGVLIWCVK